MEYSNVTGEVNGGRFVALQRPGPLVLEDEEGLTPALPAGWAVRPGAPAVRPGGRLDYDAIKGTVLEKDRIRTVQRRLLIVGHRCRSWACPKCGIGYWGRVRALVWPHLSMFSKPRLLTLTVNRDRFTSGEEAFEHVEGKHGLIRRFLRLMGFKKAFKVLAFHTKVDSQGRDGREWPHWHIVVDLADCGSWLDMKRAWRLWRDRWGVGGFDLKLRRDQRTADQAVRYAVSYCQHQSGIVPEWVEDRNRIPRAFELYGELRRAVRAAMKAAREAEKAGHIVVTGPDHAWEEASGGSKNSVRGALATKPRASTVRERLAGCMKGSEVVRESVYPNGQKFYKWMGHLSVTPGQLRLWAKLGHVEGVEVELVEGASYQGLRVSVAMKGKDCKDVVTRLEVAARGVLLANSDEGWREFAEPPVEESEENWVPF